MSARQFTGLKCDGCGKFIARGDEHWTRGCRYAAGGWPEEELTVTCGKCENPEVPHA